MRRPTALCASFASLLLAVPVLLGGAPALAKERRAPLAVADAAEATAARSQPEPDDAADAEPGADSAYDPDSTAATEAEATAPEELPDVPDFAPGEEPAELAPEPSAPPKRSSKRRAGSRDSRAERRSRSDPSNRSKQSNQTGNRAERAATAPRPDQPEAASDARPAAAQRQYDLTGLRASPVPGVESSGFGWRDDPINRRRKFHKGTDFRAPRGTAVYAAGGGEIIYAGRMGGYGNVVFIDHGDGVVSRYGHLSKILASRGDSVAAGSQIGKVGSTGRATGSHLHFEIRLDGRAVNPAVAMTVAALQRSNPTAAVAAAYALTPEVQERSVDPHPSAKYRGKRPERRGRAKRAKVLW